MKLSNIVKFTNKATINSTVVTDGNTGDNTQNKNTNAGDTTTGNVSATVTITNTAN